MSNTMAGPKTDASGRIVRADGGNGNGNGNGGQEQRSLKAFLTQPSMLREIGNALPKHLNSERMVRVVLTALSTTPGLAACTVPSFMSCVLQASQLGLECNTPLGHAYLIPRENRRAGVTECTLLIGYQGMIDLALRSKKVTGIKARVVRKGDHFVYEDGLRPVLVHRESDDPKREQQEITHAWAVAQLLDGEPIFVVLSRAQIEARRTRSANANGDKSPWKTDFEAMAAKSAVRALFKWIPKSPDMARVEHMEEASERGSVQASAFDEDVKSAIARTGLQPIDDDLPLPPPHDPDTGEVLDATGEPVPADAAQS